MLDLIKSVVKVLICLKEYEVDVNGEIHSKN